MGPNAGHSAFGLKTHITCPSNAGRALDRMASDADAASTGAHSARATAITRLLAEGIPHREVQEFSRHASIQMVELYDKRRIGVDKNPGRGLDYD